MLLTALCSLCSVFFVALIVTLGKVSIIDVDSNLNTVFRVSVVLVIAWLMATVTGTLNEFRCIPRGELGSVAASGGVARVLTLLILTESSRTAPPAWSCPSIG